MKRVIKFWNIYQSDGAKFSDCSTKYEVLPILVSNDAGAKELRAIAKSLGISTQGRKVVEMTKPNSFRQYVSHITHAMKTGEKVSREYFQKTETHDWYIGFIQLNESGPLKAVETLGKRITKDQIRQIMDDREYGLDDVGDFSMIHNKTDLKIVMSGWNYYHEIKLLGYDFEAFERMLVRSKKKQDGERLFSDSVFSCSECGTWDYNDSGYVYNYRIMHGEMLGINCGCVHEHSKSSFLSFIGDTQEPMELEAAKELEQDGMLEHVERLIGGMTDGRGGYFNGERTREGTPEGVMEEYQAKEPKSKFLFTHDESGQFQTYFSIWRVTKKGLAQNKRKAA